jgi:hypothetical protein
MQDINMCEKLFKKEDFINKGENEFIDIDSEEMRLYKFPGGDKVVIDRPLKLCVKENGHRVWDIKGVSHYIPTGWIHLSWVVKEGAPNFVK